jgi:putative peptide-modifying radical SAM enzyme
MDNVDAKHYLIQTNGLHLDEIEHRYLNRMHTILVSVDGDRQLTNHYRGDGVYEEVMKNLNLIRKNGYNGEIIARMTVSEDTDIYKQILWLLNNPNFSFKSIHWQIDAGFWKNDIINRPFAKWIKEEYNPAIKKLVYLWLDFIENKNIVLKLYPFLGIMYSLLKNETSLLRCGSGWINYSIQTDGHIIPCPIMNGIRDFYLGHINDDHPFTLKKVYVENPCTSCGILYECGGRCLYANLTKRWSKQDYTLVCDSVSNLIESLKSVLPKIKKLIKEGKINVSDFKYMKYNCCEIIP